MKDHFVECRVPWRACRSLSSCVLQCADEGVGIYIRHNLNHTRHTGIYTQCIVSSRGWFAFLYLFICSFSFRLVKTGLTSIFIFRLRSFTWRLTSPWLFSQMLCEQNKKKSMLKWKNLMTKFSQLELILFIEYVWENFTFNLQ